MTYVGNSSSEMLASGRVRLKLTADDYTKIDFEVERLQYNQYGPFY